MMSPFATACCSGPDNWVVGLTHNWNVYPLLEAYDAKSRNCLVYDNDPTFLTSPIVRAA